jgi:Ca-activated chloride channel family protein
MKKILRQRSNWRWTVLLCFWMAMLGEPVSAGEEIAATPDGMQSGSLLLRMKNGYQVATRINTSVDARISGLVARVSVRQEFRNDGSEWVEGVYVFPLPDKAAVDHLRMYIGDRFIEGEIREKEQAKKEYEAAKLSGKKAGLVEQQRANMFTTSVANIGPGESVTIEIEYLEDLAYDEGIFSLRVPMTITPRYIPGLDTGVDPVDKKGSGWSAKTSVVSDASKITPPAVSRSSDHKITFTADLNAGLPLEFVSSRYHIIDITDLGGRYHIGLADGIVPMDHDLELTWKPEPASAPRAMLFTETINRQPHMLLMMLPPDEASAPSQPMPRELIFVIDTSGSMHGTSLEQARRALGLALSGLQATDRFNIIQFNSVTSVLFPASVTADANNIGLARRYVAGLAANGGTEMAPAIGRALTGQESTGFLRQVIFITDGSVGNENQLYQLIEQRLGETRLFTVGIGSAPNSWFMRKAAEAGRGTFTTISALHEVSEKMQRLFRKLEQPRVTDVEVQWPSGNEVMSYPSEVPDLYAGEPIVLKAKLSNATRPGDLVVIRGNAALGTWAAELPVAIGEAESGIAALWARARIEDLMDRQRRGSPEEETRNAIVETALAHHLVSKYTSLVAIDKTPVRPSGQGLDSEQVANLMPYGQSQSAIFGFPATATGAGAYRVNGIVLIVVAMLLYFFVIRREGRGRRTSI